MAPGGGGVARRGRAVLQLRSSGWLHGKSGLARIDYQSEQQKHTSLGGTSLQIGTSRLACLICQRSSSLLIAAIDGPSTGFRILHSEIPIWLPPNVVNSAHATGNRSRNLTVQNSTVDLNDLFTAAGMDPGINIYQLGPQVGKFFPNFMPDFIVDGGFFRASLASTPSLQPYDTLEFSDDLSWTHGAHQFSFGGDFVNLRAFATIILKIKAVHFRWVANRLQPPLPGRQGLSDFLLGDTSATRRVARKTRQFPLSSTKMFFRIFAQDAWKLTRKTHRNGRASVGSVFRAYCSRRRCTWSTFPVPDLIEHTRASTAPSFPRRPAGYLFPGDIRADRRTIN